ncbi:MAG: ATP-binding protein [Bacillota bacterium]|nr:ATP-binding protein [Bacillota bacterium]
MSIGPNVKDAVLLFILVFSAYFLILRLFKQTREQLTLQNEQNISQMQLAAAQIHLESLQESQKKTLIYRHDMRHHLDLISAYLTDNNHAAAQNYITEVEETIEAATVETYCNNYSVNLILSSCIAKARNEQIAVETQIDLPEKNAVANMDLCMILANAIENGINACKCIPRINDRTLKIVCKTKNDKLLIQITNSFAGTVSFVNDMPVSMEENHGLGTKSIAAVAKKYNGVYSFTAEDGVFTTSLFL